MSAAAAPVLADLAPALAEAGCVLVAAGRQLVLVDAAGAELERGSSGRLDWLLAAGGLVLIRRLAVELGLSAELHGERLLVRLWWPQEDAEAAPWLRFELAVRWLLHEAPALIAAHAAAAAAAVVEVTRPTSPTTARPLIGPGRRPAARACPLLWRWLIDQARRWPGGHGPRTADPARAPPEEQGQVDAGWSQIHQRIDHAQVYAATSVQRLIAKEATMDLFGGGEGVGEEAFQTRTRSGSQMRLTHKPDQQTLEIVIISGKRDELRINDEADPVDRVTVQVTGAAAAELWEKLRLMPW